MTNVEFCWIIWQFWARFCHASMTIVHCLLCMNNQWKILLQLLAKAVSLSVCQPVLHSKLWSKLHLSGCELGWTNNCSMWKFVHALLRMSAPSKHSENASSQTAGMSQCAFPRRTHAEWVPCEQIIETTRQRWAAKWQLSTIDFMFTNRSAIVKKMPQGDKGLCSKVSPSNGHVVVQMRKSWHHLNPLSVLPLPFHLTRLLPFSTFLSEIQGIFHRDVQCRDKTCRGNSMHAFQFWLCHWILHVLHGWTLNCNLTWNCHWPIDVFASNRHPTFSSLVEAW